MDILNLMYSDLAQILVWLPSIILTLLILGVIVTALWVFFPILFLIMISRLGKIDRQLAVLIKIKEKELDLQKHESNEPPSFMKIKSKSSSPSDKNNSV